jgi:hypothetical protein
MSIVRWLLPAVWLLAAGCGDRGDLYARKLEPLPLLTTGDALVSVVPQSSRVVRVRKGEKSQGLVTWVRTWWRATSTRWRWWMSRRAR